MYPSTVNQKFVAHFFVIPAQAGIHSVALKTMDSGSRPLCGLGPNDGNYVTTL
jgi:hypothetical protein